MATMEYVKAKGIEIRFHGRGKNEASHYCGQCEVSLIFSFTCKIYTLILFLPNLQFLFQVQFLNKNSFE